jgi:hypothetical protein
MHPHQFRSDPRPQMAGRVNPLADRIAELLEAELRDVREVLRCALLTLAYRCSRGDLVLPA